MRHGDAVNVKVLIKPGRLDQMENARCCREFKFHWVGCVWDYHVCSSGVHFPLMLGLIGG